MEINGNTNLSFNAKVGTRLYKGIKEEFNGNQQKVNKFVDLFEKTFSNVLDENTVIDLDNKKHYVFSHAAFSNIAYIYSGVVLKNKPLSEAMIIECPRIFGTGEDYLFKNIVRKCATSISVDELTKMVQKGVKTNKNRKKFLEIINCAKRIIAENSNSKLSNIDFEIMENKILQEEAQTPGTEMYKILHSPFKFAVKNE